MAAPLNWPQKCNKTNHKRKVYSLHAQFITWHSVHSNKMFKTEVAGGHLVECTVNKCIIYDSHSKDTTNQPAADTCRPVIISDFHTFSLIENRATNQQRKYHKDRIMRNEKPNLKVYWTRIHKWEINVVFSSPYRAMSMWIVILDTTVHGFNPTESDHQLLLCLKPYQSTLFFLSWSRWTVGD